MDNIKRKARSFSIAPGVTLSVWFTVTLEYCLKQPLHRPNAEPFAAAPFSVTTLPLA